MAGKLAGRMMIEPAHARAALERALERLGVGLDGYVENRDFVAAIGFDALEQCVVAFHPRYELGGARRVEPQLMQRAQTVRVAVENVVRFAHGAG